MEIRILKLAFGWTMMMRLSMTDPGFPVNGRDYIDEAAVN